MEKSVFSYVVWFFASLFLIGCSLTSDFGDYKFSDGTRDAGKGVGGGAAGTSSQGKGGAGGTSEGAGGTSERDMCNLANTCGDHGKCDDSGGQIACVCDAGYDGERCETCAAGFVFWPKESAVCVDNPCDPSPCTMANANGCAQIALERFRCNCEDGFRWEATSSSCVGNCVDLDNDSYGIGPGCIGPDCNNNDPLVRPGVDEKCDGVDNNCDGRTNCAGDTCVDKDPCVDQNPCTRDTCDLSDDSFQCQNKPWAVPADVTCDPDAEGTLTVGDGVCKADATCGRRNCRPCIDANECAGGYCLCADESCSVKRCSDSPLTCQFLGGSDTECAPVNVPPMRWGENCSGDVTRACDSAAACQPHKCATCSYTGCAYIARHTDCGNSEVCGTCGGAIDVCTPTASGTLCSSGADSSCNNQCDGTGQCVSWDGKACGSTAPCAGTCANGACSTSTTSCGTSPCAGTCTNGACGTNATDCGTCCVCDASGTATYNSGQDSDCAGYDSNNVCSNRCSAIGICSFPTNATECGFGRCSNKCNGAGACTSQGIACCSKSFKVTIACTGSDLCSGTCSASGVCSSAGNSCGVTGCTKGVCGDSGFCHCSTSNCSVFAYIDTDGYKYINDLCSVGTGTCCPSEKLEAGFNCCPSTICLFSRNCEHF